MPRPMPTATDATTATFATEALGAAEPVVLVDFWAPWCAPCRALTPALESLAAERDDLKLVKVNTDEEQPLAAHYGVMGLPTVLILREGRPVGTITQAAPKRRLAAQIDAALAA
jgi:thioredoxin